MKTKEERRAKYDEEYPVKAPKRIPLRVSLLPIQYTELEALMQEDTQTNKTAFIVYLITQERKRREEEKRKRGVGRPKGSSNDEQPDSWEEEPRIYPHPDQSGPNKGRMLNKTEFDWYMENHGNHIG